MRIGYIGLSTPLFYDYGVQNTKCRSDNSNSPNPILEAPFGLMLLFDELWFLCPSLCPKNMRNLPYVKFLDEVDMLPNLADLYIPNIYNLEENDLDIRERHAYFRNSFSIYDSMVNKVGVHWGSAPDNHTGVLNIAGYKTTANSIDIHKLFFDMAIVNSLDTKVELITNTFSQRWLEEPSNPVVQSLLTDALIIDDIPNYLNPQGPYHPCIEEVRENPYLKAYRKWCISRAANITSNELLDIKREVENVIQEAQDNIFLQTFDQKWKYFSKGKTVIKSALNWAVPGTAVAYSAIEGLKSLIKEDNKWQGFLVSTRQIKNKIR